MLPENVIRKITNADQPDHSPLLTPKNKRNYVRRHIFSFLFFLYLKTKCGQERTRIFVRSTASKLGFWKTGRKDARCLGSLVSAFAFE